MKKLTVTWTKKLFMKFAFFTGLTLVGLAFVSIVVLLAYPDIYLNKYFKDKIIREFNSTYPDYSIAIADLKFNVWKNGIELKTVAVRSADSSFSLDIDRQSLSGIAWLQLLWKGDIAPDIIAGSAVNSKKIIIKFIKSQYEVSCAELNVSMYKSEIILKELDIHPLVDDNQFFNANKFRQTRLRIMLPQLKVSGLSYFGLQKEFIYHARYLQIGDLSLSVLVNKNKPSKAETEKISIPKEMSTSLKKLLNVDSLSISSVKLDYDVIDSLVSDKNLTNVNSGYSVKISDMNFNLLKNNIKLKALFLISNDSMITCNIKKPSLDGIAWNNLVYNGELKSKDLSKLVATTEEIELNLWSQEYQFRFGRIQTSFKDSVLFVDKMNIQPLIDDKNFFAESKYRRTRLKMSLSQVKLMGVDYHSLMQGTKYNARLIQFGDASLDIVVNMYKPYLSEKIKPQMPNEILLSMKEKIQIDSIILSDGQLNYGETYAPNSQPAVIKFDKMHLFAKNISNNNKSGDTAIIRADADFMSTGRMKATLFVPLTSKGFSLKYSGSLSSMKLNKLNTFIVIAEHKSITSGLLHSANFDISVKNGRAKGIVNAVYDNLELSFLNTKTNSGKGLMDKVKTFIANNFKLNGTNKPDKSGKLNSGKVVYNRMRDDTFTQYLWFALRSGVADIVGF